MSVAAVEAAAPASAEAGAAGGAGGAGAGGGGGQLGQLAGGMPGGGGDRDKAKGVLLAIAVVLLWLAGLAFFIALEGSKLLTEQSGAGGAGFLQGIVSGLRSKVTAAAGQAAPGAGEGGAAAGEGSGGSLGN